MNTSSFKHFSLSRIYKESTPHIYLGENKILGINDGIDIQNIVHNNDIINILRKKTALKVDFCNGALPSMIKLFVSFDNIEDINVSSLDDSNMRIVEKILKNQKNIKSLKVSQVNSFDLSCINESIENVFISSNKIFGDDIFFENKVNNIENFILDCVVCDRKPIVKLSAFSSKLSVLKLKNVDIDIDTDQVYENVYSLMINNGNLEDIENIVSLFPNAMNINIPNNIGIADFSKLSSMKELLYLNLSNTIISDVSCIKDFEKLLYIDIRDTAVTDYSPLEASKSLILVNNIESENVKFFNKLKSYEPGKTKPPFFSDMIINLNHEEYFIEEIENYGFILNVVSPNLLNETERWLYFQTALKDSSIIFNGFEFITKDILRGMKKANFNSPCGMGTTKTLCDFTGLTYGVKNIKFSELPLLKEVNTKENKYFINANKDIETINFKYYSELIYCKALKKFNKLKKINISGADPMYRTQRYGLVDIQQLFDTLSDTVEEICISAKIYGDISDKLIKFKNLKKLSFETDDFLKLEINIDNLPKLEILEIYSRGAEIKIKAENNTNLRTVILKGVYFENIDDIFSGKGMFNKLEWLQITESLLNNIKSEVIDISSLCTLIVTDNAIAEIPEDISHFKYVDLNGNFISKYMREIKDGKFISPEILSSGIPTRNFPMHRPMRYKSDRKPNKSISDDDSVKIFRKNNVVMLTTDEKNIMHKFYQAICKIYSDEKILKALDNSFESILNNLDISVLKYHKILRTYQRMCKIYNAEMMLKLLKEENHCTNENYTNEDYTSENYTNEDYTSENISRGMGML